MMSYIQKDQYETVQMDGEWIILNTHDYTVTKLNEVGAFCWSLLCEEQTVQSLTLAVQEKYNGVPDAAGMDVEQFLSGLLECGLIRHAAS